MQHATARKLTPASANTTPEPVRGVLRPGFTAVNNSYYLEIQNQLTLAELRLLNVIIYFTNGYLRHWCIIGEEALCRHANIARSTLYDTKKLLEAKGLIKIGRRGWACKYSLGERLGVLADDAEMVLQKRQKSGSVDPNPSGSVDPCRDTQDIYEQQHAPQASPEPEPAPNDDDLLGIIEELEREWKADVEPVVKPQATTPPQYAMPETGRLVAQLIEQGVHAKVAARLATTQTAEVIASAIARLPKVATTNPAGYLVAEISRGGYKEPDRTKPIRVIQEEIHRQRQAERERDVAAKDQASMVTASILDRFAQLPDDHQAEIREILRKKVESENLFSRFPSWGESTPGYSALLAEATRDFLAWNGPGMAPIKDSEHRISDYESNRSNWR